MKTSNVLEQMCITHHDTFSWSQVVQTRLSGTYDFVRGFFQVHVVLSCFQNALRILYQLPCTNCHHFLFVLCCDRHLQNSTHIFDRIRCVVWGSFVRTFTHYNFLTSDHLFNVNYANFAFGRIKLTRVLSNVSTREYVYLYFIQLRHFNNASLVLVLYFRSVYELSDLCF